MKVEKVEAVQQYTICVSEEELRVIGMALERVSYLNDRNAVIAGEIIDVIQTTLGERY